MPTFGVRPPGRLPTPGVLQWLRDHEGELAVNPIILGELEYGILLLPAGRRRQRLEAWFRAGASRFHCLELDAGTAPTWAHLLAGLKQQGRAMPLKDSLIAATALQHGLTVATRNTGDFHPAGVSVFNPFAV